jgi:transposase
MPERPDPYTQHLVVTPSLDELVPAGHPVRYVAAFVADLTPADWTALGVEAAKSRGAPRTAPALLVRLWLSGFVLGIRSARGLEQGCRERFDLYWACGGQPPDHNTLWRFYQQHRRSMRQLLRTTIRTAVELGLVELAVQAVDGSKIVANANPAKPLTETQLVELERATTAAIADLEAQNVGDDPAPPDLPTELHDATVLQQRVQQARASLQTDRPKALNRTDPEARFMKTRTGVQLAYNAQLVVAATDPIVGHGPGRIILAAAVTTHPTDDGCLTPMGQLASAATRQAPAQTVLVADAGYGSRASVADAQGAGFRVATPTRRSAQQTNAPYAKEQFAYAVATDTYTCPEGMVLHRAEQTRTGRERAWRYRGDPAVCRACPAFGGCTTNQRRGRTLKIAEREHQQRQQAQWMATDQAQALSARRRGLIEPVFGMLNEQMRARRTQLRGRANVEAEWVLTATAFNLRTLARAATENRPDRLAA